MWLPAASFTAKDGPPPSLVRAWTETEDRRRLDCRSYKFRRQPVLPNVCPQKDQNRYSRYVKNQRQPIARSQQIRNQKRKNRRCPSHRSPIYIRNAESRPTLWAGERRSELYVFQPDSGVALWARRAIGIGIE